jgi:hypothetical protein
MNSVNTGEEESISKATEENLIYELYEKAFFFSN